MEPFFILALFQHGYKVRPSTLYHLLRGKRTTSVLLYGFLYENLHFFQLCPELSEKRFHSILDELIEQKFLHLDEDGLIQITDDGLQLVSSSCESFSWIDNYRFGKNDEIIWRYLQFIVQVTSHLSYENKNYVPLEQSPLYQKQVKQLIKSMPKRQLIQMVKKEWIEIFSKLPKEKANFFAQQFSGYHQIGKTSFQLMNDQSNAFERFLIKKENLHHLLAIICRMPEDSIIKKFILPLIRQNENKSMRDTTVYLNVFLSLEDLAKKRKVKVSTIKDHLMEMALTKDFPFERYISKETEQYLSTYSSPYQNWEYRTIKQTIPELDYFEFRLYQIKKLRWERESSR